MPLCCFENPLASALKNCSAGLRSLLLLMACLSSACNSGPDPVSSPRQLHEAVECHLGNGEFALALEGALRGKAGWQDHPESDWYWRFHLLQAEVEYDNNEYQKALDLLEQELPEGTAFAELRARRKMLQANVFRRLREYDKAGDLLDEAQKLASEAETARLDLPILLRKSLLLNKRGKGREAEQMMRQVLEQALEQGDLYHQALALLNLGYFRLGIRDHESIAFNKSLLERITGQQCFKRIRILAKGNLAASYGRLGLYQEGREFSRQAIEQLKEMGDRLNLERAYGQLGNLVYAEGHYDEARDAYREALAGAEALQVHGDAALWAGNTTTTLIVLADWEAARRANRRARSHLDALAARSGQAPAALWNTAKTLLNEARIATGLKDDSAAERAYLKVLQVPSVPQLHWQAHAGLGRLFSSALENGKANQRFEQALGIIRQQRSELFGSASRGDSKLDKIVFFSRLAGFYRDYAEALVTQGREEDALLLIESSRALILQENLGLEDQSPWENDAGVFRQSARRLQAVFLSYWLAPGRSFLWVVTPDEVRCIPLPGSEKIAQLVQSFQGLIERKEHTLNSSWGGQLYRTLIEPASPWLGSARRAVVIPDGVLHRLNFETLPVPGPNGRYWLEEIEVSVAPSLRLLSDPVEPSAAPSSRLLLFGAAEPAPGFPRLQYAQDEAQRIQRSFAGATAITGPAAHPQAYRQSQPGQYSIIHFAAHAEANPISPLDSAVILSPPADAPESFRLQVREILTIPLPQTILVTLSACDSAGSRQFAGEGQVGLAWAFLHQGARRVIAGLWKVNDRTSAQLMDSLYQNLAAGLTAGQALTRAKREILQKGGRYSAPYYWAPFQLYRR
ncbi:MAG: CHAT domain-containing tetratricopeptide repeat protein [Acidobacteriota bacterium]